MIGRYTVQRWRNLIPGSWLGCISIGNRDPRGYDPWMVVPKKGRSMPYVVWWRGKSLVTNSGREAVEMLERWSLLEVFNG